MFVGAGHAREQKNNRGHGPLLQESGDVSRGVGQGDAHQRRKTMKLTAAKRNFILLYHSSMNAKTECKRKSFAVGP